MHEALKGWTEGRHTLADLLRLSPQIMEQLAEQALALARYGKHEEAETLLENMASVDARSAMLPFLLGTVRAARSDHAGAIAAYDEALHRDAAGASNPHLRPEAQLLRAQSYLQLGLIREATGDLKVVAESELEHVRLMAVASLSALEAR